MFRNKRGAADVIVIIAGVIVFGAIFKGIFDVKIKDSKVEEFKVNETTKRNGRVIWCKMKNIPAEECDAIE